VFSKVLARAGGRLAGARGGADGGQMRGGQCGLGGEGPGDRAAWQSCQAMGQLGQDPIAHRGETRAVACGSLQDRHRARCAQCILAKRNRHALDLRQILRFNADTL
jgi:hypothetical protein